MLQSVSATAMPVATLPATSALTERCRRSGPQEFHPPRSTLFLQGYARDRQYRLVEGCVALSQLLPDGRRQVLDILGPGRLIGAWTSDTSRCTAETLAYALIEPVEGLSAGENEAALRDMVARAQALALLLGRKTALERVATAILDLAAQFVRPTRSRKRGTVCFHLHPTRGDLADWLGLTVETVSRCFTRLKRAGLIDFQQPEIVTLLKPDAIAHIAAGGTVADTI